jgi:DNA-binding NtrC family response regulator
MSDLSAFLAGSCESFQAFAERLRTVARSDATVLLEGESGAGKGAAARALHALGSGPPGPSERSASRRSPRP